MNLDLIVNKVVAYVYDGIKTSDLDDLLAETSAYLNILHPDYSKLAARIAVTKLHKETSTLLLDVVTQLFYYRDSNG